MTQFLLLGDLELLVDGCAVEIGHARQQCVLAALLVNVNQALPADQLLERVWAERPPRRARNTLSGYLSRLRQVLTGTGAAIVRRPAGYLLAADPLSVDLHRFDDLVAQAHAACDSGTAEARLDHALGLWRGEPFAALDTPWLNEVRRSLAAKRLSAELERNDMVLRRGGHAELLEELCELAAAHPLDERLAAQLLLALYRSGRQADALARYERLRRRLADELGVDPGAELQQLHQRILATDQVLITSTARAPVPRQLPAAPRSFTGRTRELAVLDSFVDTPATVVLSGAPGVGKTALAVHWGHLVRERFPGGQLYVNLRGFDPAGSPVDPASVIRGFLEAYAVPAADIPVDQEAQAALFRGLVADKQVLLVLDNARDAQQVRPLLPAAPRCLTVVTSRGSLTSLVAVEGAHPLAVDLLTDEDARRLLIARLGAERVAAEPAALDEIITTTTRLSLALVIVAAWAATHPGFPLACLAAELSDSRRRLDVLNAGDPATDLRAVFALSCQALSPGARRLFRLAGLHPGPDLSAASTASLAGLPPGATRPLLDELAQAHLIDEHEPGRYIQHNLLRTYATELAHRTDSDELRHAAADRFLEHYLHTAYQADRILSPHRDPITLARLQAGVAPEAHVGYEQALAWFTAERRVLLCAVQFAASSGRPTYAWQLAWSLQTFLALRGHWHDVVTVAGVAMAATERLDDPHAQAVLGRLLGRGHLELGRFTEARTTLLRALELCRRLGDPIGQADVHHDLAVTCAREGGSRDHTGMALDHARRSLRLYRDGGHRPGQAGALNDIGWLHALLGMPDAAITACSEALALFEDLGDRDGQAATLDSLGYAHHCLGNHERAVDCYRRAIGLNRELGHRHCESQALSHLGDALRTAGDVTGARVAWGQALAILDALEHRDAEAVRAKLDGASAGYSRPRLPNT
ncbi:AfsR/SARP family transcriptional regulator [Amycolatopsis xylanica]|uniref:AfsR/SARP family transcriptional regulator n=1 Tax=Amycolatopsis xylanica TaxID=589385 RepID=UPI001C409906|nr:BTAD domain-containing putative transcriptional regulator [Amycolatopsis xylanica]